jgi:hypothetical protein
MTKDVISVVGNQHTPPNPGYFDFLVTKLYASIRVLAVASAMMVTTSSIIPSPNLLFFMAYPAGYKLMVWVPFNGPLLMMMVMIYFSTFITVYMFQLLPFVS